MFARLFQAALQRPDYSTGGVLERAFRADRRAVEFPGRRVRADTERFASREEGNAGRGSEEAEGVTGKVRPPQGRSFRVRLLEGHSPLQRR